MFSSPLFSSICCVFVSAAVKKNTTEDVQTARNLTWKYWFSYMKAFTFSLSKQIQGQHFSPINRYLLTKILYSAKEKAEVLKRMSSKANRAEIIVYIKEYDHREWSRNFFPHQLVAKSAVPVEKITRASEPTGKWTKEILSLQAFQIRRTRCLTEIYVMNEVFPKRTEPWGAVIVEAPAGQFETTPQIYEHAELPLERCNSFFSVQSMETPKVWKTDLYLFHLYSCLRLNLTILKLDTRAVNSLNCTFDYILIDSILPTTKDSFRFCGKHSNLVLSCVSYHSFMGGFSGQAKDQGISF